ncbi:MAG: NUDIX domain-containing protein [Candidatus Thorarchaeota archaeon]|nr:NUDIX domain-containing protein [Candidatus Thorarchaeota archaeon]
MTKIVTSAITILRCGEQFLFLKRKKPPYENLWALVGGKVEVGEHGPAAAKREVLEETGATEIFDYALKGIVSERLIKPTGEIVAHFFIFVGCASIKSFNDHHDEGDLALFSKNDLEAIKQDVLPSDYEMFFRFEDSPIGSIAYHEVELIQEDGNYTLSYYREVAL